MNWKRNIGETSVNFKRSYTFQKWTGEYDKLKRLSEKANWVHKPNFQSIISTEQNAVE